MSIAPVPAAQPAPPTLELLNAVNASAFADHLGEVFERAPWVAAAVAPQRPFASAEALHRAMLAAVSAQSETARVALFNGHPELAGAAARLGDMTADSVREQGGLALGALCAADGARWDALNAAYRTRFGFPFILCVRRHTRDSALAAFEARLANDRVAELEQALAEIGHITRLRLAARIADHGLQALHGSLAVQVLDARHGGPAAGLRVALHGAHGDRLAEVGVAGDGRATTLLAGTPLRMGRYQLRAYLGDYFGRPAGADAWLDVVSMGFAIDAPEAGYRLTLSATPGSCSMSCTREG